MKNSVINQIKQLLGMEVKLETMKLSDGITTIEADNFETKRYEDENSAPQVFVVTEDEQKIPLPVGEYELEDGRMLIVAVEGIIAEVKEVEVEEEAPEAPEAEMPEAEVEVETSTEVKAPKKTVESIIKETFFSEIEALKKENEELKAKLETFSKVDPTSEATIEEASEKVELEEVKPISYNPEKTNPSEFFKLASKRPRTTMDSILEKLNK